MSQESHYKTFPEQAPDTSLQYQPEDECSKTLQCDHASAAQAVYREQQTKHQGKGDYSFHEIIEGRQETD